MTQQNDLIQLSGRAERLIGALTEAIMSTAEAAAERVQLASEVARVQQRMAAFSAVLEAIDAQKAPLLARLEAAKGPQKALIQRQIDLLTEQEAAVLRAGRCSARGGV